MGVSISKDFRSGYINSKAENATDTYNADGTILNLKSPTGANHALKKWTIPVSPGDEVTFEIMACNIKGDPRIGFDLFYNGGTKSSYNYVKVVDKHMTEYKQTIKIPYDKEYTGVSIFFGVPASVTEDTEVEFTSPKLQVHSSISNVQTIATGMLKVANGVVTLNADYKTFGVESLSYDDTKKQVIVKLSRYQVTYGALPSVFAIAATPSFYSVSAGSWNHADFSFGISLSNGTSLVSLTTGVHYISFEVKM